jgi:hypothetical protein
MLTNAAELCSFFDRVKNVRLVGFDKDWDALASFFDPQSHGFYENNNTSGVSSRTRIFDSTPERAQEDLSSAMFSMMINPSRKYINFEIVGGDSDTFDVRKFKQEAADYVLKVFASAESNFFDTSLDVFHSTPLYGQSYVTMRKYVKEKKVKFASVPTQEGYLQRNEYKEPTAFFRKIMMTARQIRTQFKEAEGSQLDKSDWESYETKEKMAPNDQMEIIQLIMAKDDAMYGDVATLQPYTSVWIDYTKKKVLEEKGMDYFPILAPAWKLRSGEDYGRGVGHRALADTAVLNLMVKDNLGAAEAMLKPAITAPFGLVMDDQIDMSPMAINWLIMNAATLSMGGSTEIKPIHVVTQLPVGLEMEDRRRQGIIKAFYGDLLQELKNAEMSATESSQNAQARIAKLTAPFMRIEYDYLAPAAMFVLESGIEFKHIELPASLKGKTIKPVFTTSLYDALKSQKLSQLERALSSLGNTAGLPPEVKNGIMMGELSTEIFDLAGASLSVVRDPAETEEMNEKERQNQAMQQQAAASAQAGAGVRDLSQAFVNTSSI